MSDNEQDVLDAAEEYYWHGDESVDYHNRLMEAVEALHKEQARSADARAKGTADQ